MNIADNIATIRSRLDLSSQVRQVVAISGPPASGKSTLSEKLRDALNAETPRSAAVLGQDAFHFDNAILAARGDLARKGASHTFDVDGLDALLTRLADATQDVAIPVFDRSLELSRVAAEIIPAGTRVIILEGNYLLLETPPWDALRRHYTLSVSIDVDDATLRGRLMERWSDLPQAEAIAKTDGNDLPNAAFVRANSVAADITL